MLVLDPKKRYSIEQIRRHRWMKVARADDAASTDQQQQQQQQQRQPVTSSSSITSLQCGEYDEQILKLMHTLGIEPCKTIEVNDVVSDWQVSK